ncbi:MAG: arsenate reductase family protein [Aeromicrobium sp.]|uniref:Arsenate reductase n=1 Tax=uncultured bacterium A1Q1_fos_2116 TaxID=1256564 RepID=L7VW70_9BACT|nr:arsenate reductase [uncultured bacterium A1Q1_fos_2116]TXJ07589.1 MAG: arsenate reductase family protein [Aeromicrobium sp.]
MEIWINPACSKCRSAKAALDEAGIEYVERRYLDEPPTVAELSDVLDRMGLDPWDIVRINEPIAKELDLKSWGREPSDHTRWIDAMVANPKLIQRPIITASDATTVVARDAETLDDVIAHETGR